MTSHQTAARLYSDLRAFRSSTIAQKPFSSCIAGFVKPRIENQLQEPPQPFEASQPLTQTFDGSAMVLPFAYIIAGIILAPGWPHWPAEGRLVYVALFPLHAAVLCYSTKTLAWRDPGGRHFVNNPWVWVPVVILLGGLTLCTGC